MTPTKPPKITAEQLASSLKLMVDEAQLLLEQIQDGTSEQLRAAKTNLSTKLHDAKTELSLMETSAMQRAKLALSETDQAVKDHPYYAVGIAAGASILVGMLLAKI
jgi:ElaB protein